MTPLNSSISSSDPADRGTSPKRAVWRACAWAVFWLIVIDVGASLAFAYPSDPRDLSPSRWALYFDYGRSMEGRLRRATRADPERTAPITLSGWYEPLVATAQPAKTPNGPTVHFYGMSHAMRLADAVQESSQVLASRGIGAPGATANWAYGAFRRDKGRRENDVAVLALMSTTLPMITTMSSIPSWSRRISRLRISSGFPATSSSTFGT